MLLVSIYNNAQQECHSCSQNVHMNLLGTSWGSSTWKFLCCFSIEIQEKEIRIFYVDMFPCCSLQNLRGYYHLEISISSPLYIKMAYRDIARAQFVKIYPCDVSMSFFSELKGLQVGRDFPLISMQIFERD